MPIFEFRCEECKEQFEALVGQGRQVSDLKCPKCGGQDLAKLFSAFGFKGSPESKMVSSTSSSACGSCSSSSCSSCQS
ncbi:zinc ribbon domain-containing protein [Candidatus Saccharibacteria bacterium]|nr:zinc ribbon domain-containing protein [Candidatus Saccharibacteria bacterium]